MILILVSKVFFVLLGVMMFVYFSNFGRIFVVGVGFKIVIILFVFVILNVFKVIVCGVLNWVIKKLIFFIIFLFLLRMFLVIVWLVLL